MGRSVLASIFVASACLANAQHALHKPTREAELYAKLVSAVQRGSVEQVKDLLAEGANPKAGANPLFLLGGKPSDQAAIAKLLVENGANAKEVAVGGLSTLDYAIAKNPENPALVRYFLNKGVDPNQYDFRGFTALHSAVRLRETEVVKDLIAHHADVNAKTKLTFAGTTTSTAEKYEPGFLFAGQTPLMFLADKWNSQIAQLLIQSGANVKAADANGWNLFHYLAKEQNAADVPTVAALGVDINAASKQGYRPLHVASRGTSPTVVRALLNNHANPTLKNKAGQTPLDLLHADSVRIVHGFQAKPGSSSQDLINTYLAVANPLAHSLDPNSAAISAPAPSTGPNGIRYAALEMNGVTVDRAVKIVDGKSVLTLDFHNTKELSGQDDPTSLTLDGALMSFKDSTSDFPIRIDLKRGQSKRVMLEFPEQAGIDGVLTLWYHDTAYPPVFGAGIVGEELVYSPIFQLEDSQGIQVHFAIGQGQSVLHLDEVTIDGKPVASLKDAEYTLTPSERFTIPDLAPKPTKSKCLIKYRYRLAENSVWHSGTREF